MSQHFVDELLVFYDDVSKNTRYIYNIFLFIILILLGVICYLGKKLTEKNYKPQNNYSPSLGLSYSSPLSRSYYFPLERSYPPSLMQPYLNTPLYNYNNSPLYNYNNSPNIEEIH